MSPTRERITRNGAQVLRRIRGGAVRIAGREWRPDERWMKYDGRCDGMVYSFFLYPATAGALVGMWGTKEMHDACATMTDEEFEKVPYGPELVDGSFPWYWWRPVVPVGGSEGRIA